MFSFGPVVFPAPLFGRPSSFSSLPFSPPPVLNNILRAVSSFTCVDVKPPRELRCETSHLAMGTASLKSRRCVYVSRAYAVISTFTDRARWYGGRQNIGRGVVESSSLLSFSQYFKPSVQATANNCSANLTTVQSNMTTKLLIPDDIVSCLD